MRGKGYRPKVDLLTYPRNQTTSTHLTRQLSETSDINMSVSEREKQKVLDLHKVSVPFHPPKFGTLMSRIQPAVRHLDHLVLISSGAIASQQKLENGQDRWHSRTRSTMRIKKSWERTFETDDHTFRYSSAVRLWIAEKEHYSGEAVGEKLKRKRSEMIGHYTQVRKYTFSLTSRSFLHLRYFLNSSGFRPSRYRELTSHTDNLPRSCKSGHGESKR